MTKTRLIIIFLILLLIIFGVIGVRRLVNNKPIISTDNLDNLNPYPAVMNQFQNLKETSLEGLNQLGLTTSSTSLSALNNYNLKVADYDVIKSSSTIYWLAAEKTTGYLYLGTDDSLEKTKILNTPFLNIISLGVLVNDNQLVVLIKNQDPNDQSSIKVVNLDLLTSSSSVSKLPLNIKDFIISPDHQQVILTQEINEKETWLLTDSALAKFTPVFSTTYQDFQLQWPNLNTIFFYSKPSDQTLGQAYIFDLKTTRLTKVGEGVGLEGTISSSLKSLILSTNSGKKINSTLTSNQSSLSIPTTAVKCLTSNDINSLCAIPRYYLTSLDDWYKGRLQTNDDLFIIDHHTHNPNKWRVLPGLDVVNLKRSTSSQTYFFIDKKTSELWSVLAD